MNKDKILLLISGIMLLCYGSAQLITAIRHILASRETED